jgi:hypothetical protein
MIGSISLGWDLVAGRKRVPNPAAGITAFLIMLKLTFLVADNEGNHSSNDCKLQQA